ncbi:hypothetical protein H6S82_28150 [Planktothrix sp. FACHB-1355]|uniref:Uncharacterized protein n=1 Tax=Aerosakkonema funiforme FACHB-1375 TaxID=2949571 RepID=A0A926VEJ3_9CYAN|nr:MULTISPECIES: hypothetical protein [Oscillatoriales]MBD2182476.1 hypothetical protein [Aerosakkonema funiforme FACHB-1375]MBD3562688.1 hypothetical protein [Planktothrix sp. FACHB-1355]
MLTNEILEEIYQFREAHAKSFNYDVAAMFADWRKREAESGRESVTLPPKKKYNKSLHHTA